MILGIDRATPLTMSNITSLKKFESGRYANFAMRYLAGSTSWKNLSLDEANRLKAAGIKIGSIFQEGKDGTKAGRSGGITAANKALQRAMAIGQPNGSAIFFAVDYDAPPEDYNLIESFLLGAASVLNGSYKVGIYGHYGVIQAMYSRKACAYYWQTYAWSQGRTFKDADLYQYKNDITISGVNVDLNECRNENIFWGKGTNMSETPTNTSSFATKADFAKIEKEVSELRAAMKQISNLKTELDEKWDRLSKSLEIETDPPIWFTSEFKDYEKYVSNLKGTPTFWRAFAVSLRISKN